MLSYATVCLVMPCYVEISARESIGSFSKTPDEHKSDKEVDNTIKSTRSGQPPIQPGLSLAFRFQR